MNFSFIISFITLALDYVPLISDDINIPIISLPSDKILLNTSSTSPKIGYDDFGNSLYSSIIL